MFFINPSIISIEPLIASTIPVISLNAELILSINLFMMPPRISCTRHSALSSAFSNRSLSRPSMKSFTSSSRVSNKQLTVFVRPSKVPSIGNANFGSGIAILSN